jgi:hypothetical protein
MQKISSYLYPNRIQLLADLAGFPVEYTNVYQRTINLYKGIDNTLEFDVKNADQKRIDLSDLALVFTMMDTEGNQILQKEVTVFDQETKKGLAAVTVLASELVNLNHQFFRYSVYADDGAGTQTLLYGDSRFGAKGTIELKGDAMPTPQPDRVMTTFLTMTDEEGTTIWTSGPLSPHIYVSSPTTVTTMAIYTTGLTGDVEVQVSLDASLSNDAIWTTLETISIEPSDTITNRTYTGMYNWFRLKYTNGSTVYDPVAGSVDKFIIRS